MEANPLALSSEHRTRIEVRSDISPCFDTVLRTYSALALDFAVENLVSVCEGVLAHFRPVFWSPTNVINQSPGILRAAVAGTGSSSIVIAACARKILLFMPGKQENRQQILNREMQD